MPGQTAVGGAPDLGQGIPSTGHNSAAQGDFASGFAAQLVPASSLSLHTAAPLGTLPLKLYEIRHLAQFAITTAANAEQANQYETSKIAYDLIFSPSCSMRIRTLLNQLNIYWTWNDPKGYYIDDIKAYARALPELLSCLDTLVPS